MPNSPKNLTDRPSVADEQATDILEEVLSSLRLTTLVYGRFELGAPWALRFPGHVDAASLYIVGRGGAHLETETGAEMTSLAAGDVALIPRTGAHILRDGEGGPLHVLGEGECRRPASAEPIRLGGSGARTTLVAGGFQFGSTRRMSLFESLPAVIHISASDSRASPWLSATVQLLMAESAARSPGGTVVMSRLVDVLLVHALRMTITDSDCKQHGLCALADPRIGRALQLIHAQPAHPWSVGALATAVGLSRSGFAARFTQLVGEAPLEYVAHWRMQKATELLRESDLSMVAVAERVGYRSEASFNRAFKRWEGTAPATYRRQWAAGTSASIRS